MNSLDTEFHRRFVAHVDEAISNNSGAILSGTLDHLEYKRISGYIKALSDVKEWCGDIEKSMNEGK